MPDVMGGTHLHTPQSIFQHTMNQLNTHPDDAPWMQVPHIPQMTMPWSMPSFQQPDVVRFTGEKPKVPCEPILHHKRKMDMPPDLIRPAKNFITEEKMAAHFQGLNLNATSSNNILPSGNMSMNMPSIVEKSECPKLVISEELKNIQPEPVLPHSIFSKLERPSMALVLWQPPSKHLHNIISLRRQDTQDSEPVDEDFNRDSANNNSETLPDLNQITGEDFDAMDVEPINL